MKFIKIAAISFLAGNTVDGAALPEVSEACISAFETFEACATEGLFKDTDLFINYLKSLGEAAGCFEAAADEAAMASCAEPVFLILAEACPSGVDPLIAACDETPSTVFGDLALVVFGDIAGNVKDAAFKEDEDEEELHAEVSEACISAFETFEACVTEGLSKDTDLFTNYLKALGEADVCFEAAADEAAMASCAEPVFLILGEACPSGVDPLIAACDETPSTVFGDLALDVFDDIAGNVKDAAFWEDEDEEELHAEVSEACISAFETFEACATEGLLKDTDLFINYLKSLGEAAGCFEAAADEAAMASCAEPVFLILAEACPSGVDPLIAACDETPSTVFGDLALDVFDDIASNVKDAASSGKKKATDVYAYAYSLRGRRSRG